MDHHNNGFDPAQKDGKPPQQYAYALPVQQPGQTPSMGAAVANAGGGGGGDGSYNIDLNATGFGSGKAQPQQQQQQQSYPEAEINYTDPNTPPVEGEALYAPEEVAASPGLKRFVKGGCRDVWAAVLFLLLTLLTIVWGIVNMATYELVEYTDDEESQYGTDETPLGQLRKDFSLGAIIATFIIALVVSLVGAILSLTMAKLFPGQLIYLANILVIVMYIASGILFVVDGYVVGLIVMLVMAALQALWLFLVRSRIPFAAALLCAATRVLGRYKAIFFSNILLSLVFFVFCIFWGYAMIAPLDKCSANRCSGGNGVLIGVFVLSFLWAAQVIKNIMHVTTSGVVATWYFAGMQNMPKNPTLASFKRAITTSFGSICFGSLLVAFIQFLRFLVESSRNSNDNNFLQCIAECVLRCIESIIQYFNTYAFVHVAVYGCGYVEAAKRTFALCKQCFFAAYFNDCLVEPTLSMLALVAALLIGAIFGLLLRSWFVFAWVFALAWIVQALMFSAVSSAITAIFVCFAEAPAGLQASDPELYAQIHAADRGQVHSGNAPAPVSN